MVIYNATCFIEQRSLSVGPEGRRPHSQQRAGWHTGTSSLGGRAPPLGSAESAGLFQLLSPSGSQPGPHQQSE